jgi:hypothetical protein
VPAPDACSGAGTVTLTPGERRLEIVDSELGTTILPAALVASGSGGAQVTRDGDCVTIDSLLPFLAPTTQDSERWCEQMLEEIPRGADAGMKAWDAKVARLLLSQSRERTKLQDLAVKQAASAAKKSASHVLYRLRLFEDYTDVLRPDPSARDV